MTEKMSTIILKVDLQCSKCHKKIKDTLSKLEDRYKIGSIVYDEKNNIVAISGPFDPNKLIKKICCKACKVIQDIQIVENVKPADPPPPPPPPPPPEEPTPEPPPPEPEPAPPQPEPVPPAPAEPEPAPPASAEPEPEPEPPAPEPEKPAKPSPPPPAPEPEPEPPKHSPEPPKPEPVAKPPEPAYPYPTPVWTPGPGCCCCRPWYVAYQGGCRCCSCGCVYGPVNTYPPPQVVYTFGGPCYDGPKTCEFICEEQPSTCVIM